MAQSNTVKYRSALEEKQREFLETLQTTAPSVHVSQEPDVYDLVAEQQGILLSARRLDTTTQTLHDISQALARIEKDEFGTCMRCEQEIASKRLNAVPWAKYCIDCQGIVDKQSSHKPGEEEMGAAA